MVAEIKVNIRLSQAVSPMSSDDTYDRGISVADDNDQNATKSSSIGNDKTTSNEATGRDRISDSEDRDRKQDNTDDEEEIVVRKINTGRWTAQEHELFLEGLKKYGKEWKRVAANVGTRSVMQTRTHAQKHFDRLKPGGGRGGIWGTTKPTSLNKETTTTASSATGKRSNSDYARDPNVKSGDNSDDDEQYGSPPKKIGVFRDGKPPDVPQDYPRADLVPSHLRRDYMGPYPPPPHVHPGVYDATGAVHPSALAGAGVGYVLPPPSYGHLRVSTTPSSGMRSPHHFLSTVPGERSQAPTSPDAFMSYQPDYYGSTSEMPPLAARGAVGSPCTDRDILLPMTSHTIKRGANREYLDLLRANASLFHALPTTDQTFFVRNICNFLQVVRGRRWFYISQQWGTPYPLLDPTSAVAGEFRQDTLKHAALQYHPFWLLGEYDSMNAHRDDPFSYRQADGSWTSIGKNEAREILRSEGPKSILVLPASIQMSESFPNNTNRPIKIEGGEHLHHHHLGNSKG